MPFLGLTVEDRKRLATLSNMQFGGEMSELDDAGTYFDLGPRKVTENGIYHYISSRNNNFSNRDQKAKLVVSNVSSKTSPLGANGGRATSANGRAYLTVRPGAFNGLAQITLATSPKSSKSSLSGDVHSDYVNLSPTILPLVQGATVELTILYDKNPVGAAKMYSADGMFGSWSVIDASFADGKGSADITQGGYFVIQAATNWGAVVGVTIGVLVVLFGGVAIGYRKFRRPDTTGMKV
jgi:hypothetical protein